MALYRAGTLNSTVGRCSAMVSRALSGVGRPPIWIAVAPTHIGKVRPLPSP